MFSSASSVIKHVRSGHGGIVAALALAVICADGLAPRPAYAQKASSIAQSQQGAQPSKTAPAGNVIHKHLDMREAAATSINVSVENGGMKEFMEAVGSALSPTAINIETRHTKIFHATLKVSGMPVEDVLRAVAGFAHCELYVLPDKFLIAPPDFLRPSEKAQLTQEERATNSQH